VVECTVKCCPSALVFVVSGRVDVVLPNISRDQRLKVERDKSAAVRALPVFLNQTYWFLPHGNAGCAEGTADTVF